MRTCGVYACDGITLHAYTPHVCMCEDVWYMVGGKVCVCVWYTPTSYAMGIRT